LITQNPKRDLVAIIFPEIELEDLYSQNKPEELLGERPRAVEKREKT